MAKKPRKSGDPRKQGGGGRTTAAGTRPKAKASPARLIRTPMGPMFPTQRAMTLAQLRYLDAALDEQIAKHEAARE